MAPLAIALTLIGGVAAWAVAHVDGLLVVAAAVAAFGWWQTARHLRAQSERLAQLEREARVGQTGEAKEEDTSRLLALLSRVPVGLLWVRKGRVDWVNGNASQGLAIDPTRHLGQPVIWFLPDPHCWHAVTTSAERSTTIRVSRHGRERVWQLRWFPEGEAADSGLLWLADISDEVQAAKMREELLANVSHELRTPLTVLLGGLETVNERDLPLAAEERDKLLLQCEREARRMLRLVDDLLRLAELEGGAAHAAEWLDVVALLDEAAEVARHAAPPGLTIAVELPEELATEIYGIDAEIAMALRNLVTNAVRYTPPPGTVTLGAKVDGGHLDLFVADTGIGIPEEHLPRLTERFYRVDRARSRASGGTGLGLAIVRQVADRHEATLEITSRVGEGSTFRLRFPRGRWRAQKGYSSEKENQR
ncbi:ATP-binding protein [Hydrogenophilus islandicus]